MCPSVDAAFTRFRLDGTKKDGKVRRAKHLFQLREQFHRFIVCLVPPPPPVFLRHTRPHSPRETLHWQRLLQTVSGFFPLAPPSLVSFPDKLRPSRALSDGASLQISTFVQVFTAIFPNLTDTTEQLWREKCANINNPSSDYTNSSRVTKAHLHHTLQLPTPHPPPPCLPHC